MKTRIAIFLLAAFCAAFSCNPPVQPEPVPEEGAVKVYTTNTSGLRFQESSRDVADFIRQVTFYGSYGIQDE